MPEEVADRPGHASFFVPGAEYDLVEAGEDDRSGAHRAWLERHVQGAPIESPASEHYRCLADGEQLRMGRRILVPHGPVRCPRDDPPIPDDHSADGYVCSSRRLARVVER